MEGQLTTRWAERRLPDDLPRFVAANALSLPKKARDELEKLMADRKTPFFSTHPAMARRIEAVQALGEEGIFRPDVPAWAVFRDFHAVCRQVSYIHYRAVLGEDIFQATLVPTGQVIEQQRSEVASGDALSRFFPGSLGTIRPVFPHVLEITPPRDAKEAMEDLKDARAELELRLPEFEQTVERFKKAADKLSGVRIARDLVGAGIKVRARDFELAKATSETLREAVKAAEQGRETVLSSLEPGIAAARRRLVTALRLLYVGGIDKRLPAATAYRERIPALLQTLGAMKECQEQARQLRIDLRALIVLLSSFRGNEKNELYFPRVRDVGQRVQRSLNSVISSMGVTEYPYQHSRGTVSIAEVLRTGVPANPDYPVELAQNAEAALEGMLDLYFRALGELATMAEKVETLLKLPPIEAPASTKAEAKGGSKEKDRSEELQPV